MKVKHKVTEIVNVNQSTISRKFDLFIMFIIFLSVITYSISTIPNLDLVTKKYIGYLDNIFIMIFSIEYLLRLYASPKKLKYIFSFYGLVDLLSILPFYLGLFYDGEFIKALRFLRMFRLLKITRYSKTMQKFYLAFYNAREEFTIFAFITILMFYLASVGIYQFENEVQPETFGSVFQSMWWAVATLTTVGYGDVYPITVGGKIFTTLILIIGLGVVGIPAGIIAAAFSELGVNDDIKDADREKEESQKVNSSSE